MTQRHLATRFRIHNVFTNNPALPFRPKLGTSICSLAIYKPTPLLATPTPLCILNMNSILASSISLYFYAARVCC
jgi:hypothetical protein